MRSFLSPLLHVGLALGTSCSAPEGSASGSGDPPAEVPSVSPSDSVRLEIEVPDSAVSGAPVAVHATLRNVSERTLDLYLRGREVTADVIVTGAAGDTVWRRLEGELVPAILQLRSLPPGGTLEIEATWPQTTRGGRVVPPGLYRITVEILAEGEPFRSEPAVVRVIDG